MPLPHVVLDVSKYVPVKTNSYGRFHLNKGFHEYSASPRQANQTILIRLTAQHVIVLDESHKEIVKHDRLYGEFKQSSMQWLPYLNQLAKKPGALKYTGIYELMPKSMQEYLTHCSKDQQGQVLKAIASLTGRDGFESAVKAVDSALIHQAYDPDSLLNLHARLNQPYYEPMPILLDHHVPRLSPVSVNLSSYDASLTPKGGER